jgi:hypothetical protein
MQTFVVYNTDDPRDQHVANAASTAIQYTLTHDTAMPKTLAQQLVLN